MVNPFRIPNPKHRKMCPLTIRIKVLQTGSTRGTLEITVRREGIPRKISGAAMRGMNTMGITLTIESRVPMKIRKILEVRVRTLGISTGRLRARIGGSSLTTRELQFGTPPPLEKIAPQMAIRHR
jgi:hypothetical protein